MALVAVSEKESSYSNGMIAIRQVQRLYSTTTTLPFKQTTEYLSLAADDAALADVAVVEGQRFEQDDAGAVATGENHEEAVRDLQVPSARLDTLSPAASGST